MTESRLGVIILAAGLSSRMQGFKPLLEVADKPLIEHAIGLFQSTGLAEIITVVGHHAEQLIPVLASTASEYVVNSNYRQGMFSSVQKGVANRNPDWHAFFLLPVDIPLVQPDTIEVLAEAFRHNPEIAVCYPRHQNRRGHPPLISRRLAGEILTYAGPGGLRGLLRQYEEQALDVPVDDPFILRDADSRQDLAALRDTYSHEIRRRAGKRIL